MFLYLIINSNNKILGYGITGNPKERIRKYNEANAANQEFIKMYFGELEKDNRNCIEIEEHGKIEKDKDK